MVRGMYDITIAFVCLAWISEKKKQLLFPYTALTEWFT